MNEQMKADRKAYLTAMRRIHRELAGLTVAAEALNVGKGHRSAVAAVDNAITDATI